MSDSKTKEPVCLEVSRSRREVFQRQLETGRADLSPANLLEAVEGLEERKWRDSRYNWGLSEGLGMLNDTLDEVASQHSHLSDRPREVFSYFLRMDPDASWRKVVWALDWVDETKLADRLRPLAEPVTDPTLTVEAVAAALQSVGDWSQVANWLVLPDSIKHSIRDSHPGDEERKRALADYFVQTLPGASWSLLAGALLHYDEAAALKAVSSHLQREDDPTLTLPNLLSVLEGVTGSFSLGTWLGVPRSKLEGIRSSPSDSERVERVLKEWLEGHPAPSWRGLARALYRMRDVPEHTALQRVYDKHLPETEAALLIKELEHGMFHHDNRKLEIDDISLGEEIGAGGFGSVFRGSVKGWEGEVAIKQVRASGSSDVKEIMTLCDLEHPNVITLYGTAFKHPHLYIVTELAGLGSLHSHIQKSRGQPDMELSLHWAAGVARGTSYLHERDVVHRDLKSPNVLLTSKKTAKLCDFGIARKMDHTTQATLAGTIAWMAPEVINEEAYSKSCDLFSYGTVLWEMVTHEVPFEKLNSDFKKMKAITDDKMPPIPECVADYLTTLIQRCWDKEPKNRPPFTEIISVLEAKGPQEGGPEEGTG